MVSYVAASFYSAVSNYFLCFWTPNDTQMEPTCHPHDSGALAFVNLLGNKIPPEQAQELIKVMESKENLRTLCGFTGEEKELDLSNKGLTAGCAVLVSNEIQDNGALASANLLGNNIGKEQIENLIKIKKEKGMITLCGLKEGQTEADFSNQGLNADDAMLIAHDIQDKGALAKLTIGESKTPATLELGMTEGNFSGAGLGAGGAIILAAWIEHK